MDEHVYITRIESKDVGGFHDKIWNLGKLTLIYGTNGVGKSTLLNMIRRFFEGGYDPDFVRNGAEKAVVKTIFSNGNYGLRVVNTKTRKSTLEFFSASGESIRPPQESLSQYATGFAFDPLAMLKADRADRVDYLERFIDVKVHPEEILEACGQDSEFLRLFDPKDSAFINIDRAHDSAMQQRRKINNDAEALRGAVQVVRQGALPLNAEGKDWSKAEKDARGELIAAESAHKAALAQANEEAKGARDAARVALANTSKEIEAEYLAALRAAEQQKDRRMAEARTVEAETIKAVGDSLVAAKADIEQVQGKAMEAARLKYAAVKRELDAYNEAVGARRQIEKLEVEITEKAGKVAALTNTLTRLDELRAIKAKSNPIEGLEVRAVRPKENAKLETEIYYNDLPWGMLNTGQQVKVCILMALQGTGKCPIIIFDDTDHLQDDNFEAFLEAIRAMDIQLVAARLDDGELRIETEGVAA